LCKELGDTPNLLPATWGLYQYKLIRANYGEILEHADELLQLFTRGDASAMVIADRFVGMAFLLTGDLARGRLHFERIVSTYVPARHRPLTWEYAQEPGMAGHALLGLTLWLLGFPDQALVHSEESERLGRDVPQHNSQANALFWAGTHHQFRNEPRRVAELAKALISLASDQGLKFWMAVGACQLGTALVAEGAAGEGLERMRRGIAGSRGAGAELLQTFNFCALGEAYGRAARPREGLAALDEAEALVAVHNERFWEAEIHRLRGELLLMDGADPLQAVAHFERSISVARGQGAKSLELRASTSLGRLWQQLGRRAEAEDRLTSIYGWFVEGFDTPDLKDACKLIGELRASS
jgi:tetratricopeptide (TPR) repeat protein